MGLVLVKKLPKQCKIILLGIGAKMQIQVKIGLILIKNQIRHIVLSLM